MCPYQPLLCPSPLSALLPSPSISLSLPPPLVGWRGNWPGKRLPLGEVLCVCGGTGCKHSSLSAETQDLSFQSQR